MSEPEPSGTTWRAPYMSYETLVNFFDKKIGDNPVPPRIDTQFLDNYAGSVRPLLVATLKTLGMLDDNSQVLEPLRQAVRSPDARKAVLRSWAEPFYAEQIALGKRHATAAMLWETFGKQGALTGSTLRRAVIFYLALAKDIGLPVSAHFKSPKAPPSSRKTPRTPPPTNGEKAADSSKGDGKAQPGSGDGDTYSVNLASGGSVSVVVSVNLFQLTKADRKFVIDLVDAMKEYGADSPDGEDVAVGTPTSSAATQIGGEPMTE